MVKVRVSCADVKLRLTLNERLLGKTLLEAVVSPFINAYNQKTGAQLTHGSLAAVKVDGASVDCTVASAASVLRGDEPSVVLVLPAGSAPNGSVNGLPQGLSQMMATLGAAGGMGGLGGGNMDMAAAMEAMKGMDPTELAKQMKSVQHMLPPEMRKVAERISTDELTTGLKKQAPSSAAEVAYAGVDHHGSRGEHVRSGPPIASPADGSSVRAASLLLNARRRIAKLEDEERDALSAASAAIAAVVPGAKVAKMATVDGRLLVALDGAIEAGDVEGARFALEHRAAFRRAERSRTDRPEQQHGVTEHDAAAFCATPLYRRIATLASLFFPDRVLEPNRIYTNAMTFGDVAYMHRDGERASEPERDNVTALLYPNEAWDSSLAGETVFFSEQEDAREVVLPKPGRLLLFTASVQHVGRPPSRLFWGQRFTLAIKFTVTTQGAVGELQKAVKSMSRTSGGDAEDSGDDGLQLEGNGHDANEDEDEDALQLESNAGGLNDLD